MEFCKTCLLPETYPNLHLNADGRCEVCVAHKEKFEDFDPEKAEMELKARLDPIAGNNGRFVVTCSGGIDSSYVLYLCKTRYGLDVVGANFDHGFQSDTARQNLANLSEALAIPITTIRPDSDLIYRLYRQFLLKTGEPCSPCCQGCCTSGFIVAESNNTRTIIHGGVSGSRVEFNVLGMIRHNYADFMEIAGDDYDADELHKIVTQPGKSHRFDLISLAQYLDWDERAMVRVLREEVGWQGTPSGRTRRVDCTIAEAEDYFLQRKFGFSRYWMQVSADLRAGLISRDEGLSAIRRQESGLKDGPSDAIDILLNKTGVTPDQLRRLPFYTARPAVDFL